MFSFGMLLLEIALRIRSCDRRKFLRGNMQIF